MCYTTRIPLFGRLTQESVWSGRDEDHLFPWTPIQPCSAEQKKSEKGATWQVPNELAPVKPLAFELALRHSKPLAELAWPDISE